MELSESLAQYPWHRMLIDSLHLISFHLPFLSSLLLSLWLTHTLTGCLCYEVELVSCRCCTDIALWWMVVVVGEICALHRNCATSTLVQPLWDLKRKITLDVHFTDSICTKFNIFLETVLLFKVIRTNGQTNIKLSLLFTCSNYTITKTIDTDYQVTTFTN